MKYFEELNHFLDGTLPADKEQELFLAMASNDELRRTFQQMAAIRSEMRSHAAKTKAPKASKAAIMTGLGVQNKSLVDKIVAGARHFRNEFIVAGATAIITILAVTGLNNFDSPAQNIELPEVAAETPAAFEIIIPQDKYTALNSAARLAPVVSNTIEEYIENDSKPEATADSRPQKAYNTIASSNGVFAAAQYSSDEIPAAAKIKSGRQYIPYNTQLAPEARQSCSNSIALEFMGSDHLYFTDPMESSGSTPLFFNKTLGITYSPDQYITIGISARNERFLVNYQETDNRGLSREIEQQPNLITFQGDIRLIYGNESFIDPFVQISAGINSFGYVARTAAGLRIDPSDNLAFVLSCEYSSMWFGKQRNFFNAEKMGFNYGIRYKIF